MTSTTKPVEWRMKVSRTSMIVLKLYKIVTAIIKELKGPSYKEHSNECRKDFLK